MSTRLIVIIVMLSTALILGVVLVWPKYQDFQSVQLDLANKTTELDSKIIYYAKIKEIWTRLSGYNDVLSKINIALPRSYSIPVLFNYFQQTAGATGLVVEGLTFEGVTGEEIKEINFSLRVSGDYTSLKNFLAALESSDRFFQVKKIGFSSPEEGQTFSSNLSISAYSY